MVSSRGRRDRWHRGQRKRVSQSHQQSLLVRGGSAGPSTEGKGTQPPWNQSLQRWQRWSKGLGGPLHTQTGWLDVWEGEEPPFCWCLSEGMGVSESVESLHLCSCLMSLGSLSPGALSRPGLTRFNCWRRRRASFSCRSPSLNAITWLSENAHKALKSITAPQEQSYTKGTFYWGNRYGTRSSSLLVSCLKLRITN